MDKDKTLNCPLEAIIRAYLHLEWKLQWEPSLGKQQPITNGPSARETSGASRAGNDQVRHNWLENSLGLWGNRLSF
jgi:hypothetical protein